MRRELKTPNPLPSRAKLFADQRSRNWRSGFTLVEVLVALAILSVSLGAIVPLFSDIAHRSTRSEAERVSLALAESKLAEAGTTIPIREGTAGGADGKFRWALAIRQNVDILRENPYGLAAYDVAVTVAWLEGSNERSVSLRTLRLGQRP
ncbi:MAG: type II secretion system protein [Alphaproteobacteria bacterium]|nr:type II secretion system protein [Alphaproteobacteria bacterium]